MLFSNPDNRSLVAWAILWSLLGCCLLLKPVFAQSSQSYLDALSDEASGLKLDSQTRVEQNEISNVARPGLPSLGDSTAAPGAIQAMKTGLGQAEFERFLKDNYMGSYLFFRRLNPVNRDKVYQFYLENPDPEQVREKILEVNKN